MPEIKDIVKLAVDAHRGSVEKYTMSQSMDTLREALIEANCGSTVLNYRNIRDGKCNGLFTIIEEILSRTIIEDLQNDDFFMSMVDFRNMAEGDQNLFIVDDVEMFVVAEVADGTQAIRRQRLSGSSEISIPTSMKMVRIYEELNRVLSGRVDFNHFIDVVAKSFNRKILDDIYSLWSNITYQDLGGIEYFPVAGDYDEDDLLDVIAHVEAAAGGKPATIIGTKKACRMLAPSIMSDLAKDELHNMGYYGKFYGTPVVAMPQRHKVGTTSFVFNDNVLTVVAGDDKLIKFVYEGDPIVLTGDPMNNADFTQEYLNIIGVRAA